jgi:hypothetical protein
MKKKGHILLVFLDFGAAKSTHSDNAASADGGANMMSMEPQISASNHRVTATQAARNKDKPDRFSRGSFYACDVKDTGINMETFFSIDTNDLIS